MWKLEALRERRPPWPRQIITPILPTVKILSLGGERLPLPPKKRKKNWIITCTTIWVYHHCYGGFFAHLLILEYPDHHQNLISSSLYYPGPLHKISSQSVHNFLSNVVHRQTDRQTNKQTNATKNITSFAKEVITSDILVCYVLDWECVMRDLHNKQPSLFVSNVSDKRLKSNKNDSTFPWNRAIWDKFNIWSMQCKVGYIVEQCSINSFFKPNTLKWTPITVIFLSLWSRNL